MSANIFFPLHMLFFSGCLLMDRFIFTSENYILQAKKIPKTKQNSALEYFSKQHVFFHCLYLGTVSQFVDLL